MVVFSPFRFSVPLQASSIRHHKLFKDYHGITIFEMSKKSKIITLKMTPQLDNIVHEYVVRDTHMNKSEFIRTAIREKIMRDAPHLIKDRL